MTAGYGGLGQKRVVCPMERRLRYGLGSGGNGGFSAHTGGPNAETRHHASRWYC